MNLYVFKELEHQPYYPCMEYLIELLDSKQLDDISKKELPAVYAELFAVLVAKKAVSLSQAIAEDLLFINSAISDLEDLPKSLKEAALLDITVLQGIVKRDLSTEVAEVVVSQVPNLNALSSKTVDPTVEHLEDLLLDGKAFRVLDEILRHNRKHGTGLLSKHHAYRFSDGIFEAIEHPVHIPMSRFIGIDKQLNRLIANTEAFLGNKPAQHALLYGMRGSGKSSAVRSLLPAYAEQGLRMIELAPAHLTELNTVVEGLRSRPHKYILFVDDLAFEQNDNGFQPLKTLLEGSLSSQPENVLVYATSNRRHLVKEGFKDRPDPLDDDIHKWDTQNEKLALSDRFGLTITFPNMQQRQYLEVVNGLIVHEGLEVGDVKQEAIKFADWGNGYSGRTAQQFIRHLKANC